MIENTTNNVVEQSTVTLQQESTEKLNDSTPSFEELVNAKIVEVTPDGTIIFAGELVCSSEQEAVDSYSIYHRETKDPQNNKTTKQIIKIIKDEFKRIKSIEKQKQKIAKEKDKILKQQNKAEYVLDKIDYYSDFGIDVDEKGHVMQNAGNYKAALLIEEEFGSFRWNEFSEFVELNGKPLTDNDVALITNKMSDLFSLESPRKIENAIIEVALDNTYHPVKKYLESLVWDGTPRVDTLLHDILSADDTELNRVQTRLFLYAAIKRVYKPGCKFDNMLVLQGDQGNGKSTFCELLAVFDKWYNDNISIGDKDSLINLQDAWIVIMDEMDKWNKADSNAAKGFISKRSDKFRSPYGKRAEEHLRHCVFIGNTNDATFLKDSTGLFERRYWVVKTSGDYSTAREKIKKLKSPGFIDQIWAEMKQYYDENPYIELVIPEHLYEVQKNEQLQFKIDNDCAEYDFLEDVLNQKYSDSIYNNTLKLYEEYTGKNQNGTAVGEFKIRDFFLISSLDKLLTKEGYFKKKTLWKNFCEWTQTKQWTGSRWKKTQKKYKGRVYKVLERIVENSSANDLFKMNNILTKDEEIMQCFM